MATPRRQPSRAGRRLIPARKPRAAAMDPALPTFRGLVVYRHLGHRFSLLYPEGWEQVDAGEQAGGGTAFAPGPDDPQTFVLVQSRRLTVRVRPDDLGTLREG